MKRARFTEDQIIGVLREHEAGVKTVFDNSTEVTSNAASLGAGEGYHPALPSSIQTPLPIRNSKRT